MGGGRARPFAYPRSHRLTRGSELEAVRREGKRIRTGTLEVRAAASLLSHPRVGIVVPKYKHTGVARNLVKRRLRELSRTRLLPALGQHPADVTLRALPSAYAASFDALARDVERAIGEIRRLPRPAPAAQDAASSDAASPDGSSDGEATA